MRREVKDIECKHCSRKAAGLYYAGLVCWGYLCVVDAAKHGLTLVR